MAIPTKMFPYPLAHAPLTDQGLATEATFAAHPVSPGSRRLPAKAAFVNLVDLGHEPGHRVSSFHLSGFSKKANTAAFVTNLAASNKSGRNMASA